MYKRQALDPAGALRESNQAGSLQPTILVSYQADLGPIFDTLDTGVLSKYGMSDAELADTGWRAKMLGGQPVPTQNFAEALIAEGYAGLFTRSYAKGSTADDFNIVLWRWTGAGCSLAVVDDENRLSRL